MSLSMQGIKTVDLMMMPGIVEDKEVLSLYTDRRFPIKPGVLHDRKNNTLHHYIDSLFYWCLFILGGEQLVREYIKTVEMITPHDPLSITNGIQEKLRMYIVSISKYNMCKIILAKCIYEILANFRSILFIPIRLKMVLCRVILASSHVVSSIAEASVSLLSLINLRRINLPETKVLVTINNGSAATNKVASVITAGSTIVSKLAKVAKLPQENAEDVHLSSSRVSRHIFNSMNDKELNHLLQKLRVFNFVRMFEKTDPRLDFEYKLTMTDGYEMLIGVIHNDGNKDQVLSAALTFLVLHDDYFTDIKTGVINNITI